ncbi:hypothetical protein IMZ29_03770 [Achromobacter sp. GG226]|uniref:hypothetical protein n=1 Tax=Verticiella alkaliphila TaxID=2779529 RepID=UPI001C0BEA3C|nr:hypothetical protein [Verticiella sp. GG226]MBU4609697.1 hypothetical protein [Verticiella sp. GG226]
MTQTQDTHRARRWAGGALMAATVLLGGIAIAATGTANDATGGSGAMAPAGPGSTDTQPGMQGGEGMGAAAGRHAQPGGEQGRDQHQGMRSTEADASRAGNSADTSGGKAHSTSPATGASGSNSGNAQQADVPTGNSTR